jgi:hypothetical protein
LDFFPTASFLLGHRPTRTVIIVSPGRPCHGACGNDVPGVIRRSTPPIRATKSQSCTMHAGAAALLLGACAKRIPIIRIVCGGLHAAVRLWPWPTMPPVEGRKQGLDDPHACSEVMALYSIPKGHSAIALSQRRTSVPGLSAASDGTVRGSYLTLPSRVGIWLASF